MAYHARPNQPTKYKQGYYSPINESKYISNLAQIVYRSSLEYRFCVYADNSPQVVRWGSEVVSIPYIGADNKQHTYHIDFYLELKNVENPNLIDRILVEVKPDAEIQRILSNNPPPKPEKITPKSLKNWEYSLKEYHKNCHKWAYAQEWARQRSMKFILVGESKLASLFK